MSGSAPPYRCLPKFLPAHKHLVCLNIGDSAVEGLRNLNFHDFSPETILFLIGLHRTLLYGQITRLGWIEGEAAASIVNFMLSRFTRQP